LHVIEEWHGLAPTEPGFCQGFFFSPLGHLWSFRTPLGDLMEF